MSNSIQPFRLIVGFIAHQSTGYSRDFSINIKQYKFPPDLALEDIKGNLRISKTTQGLLLEASLQAKTKSECVRCLEPFDLDLFTEFTELYAFSSHAGVDKELVFPENGIINLTPLIREYFLLAIPINPICNPDCKGLCPICGANLNTNPCNHQQEQIDPRLAILKTLQNKT